MTDITLTLSSKAKTALEKRHLSESNILQIITQPEKQWEIFIPPEYKPEMQIGTRRYLGHINQDVVLVTAYQQTEDHYKVYCVDKYWEETYVEYMNFTSSVIQKAKQQYQLNGEQILQIIEEADYIARNFHYKTINGSTYVVEVFSQQGGPTLSGIYRYGDKLPDRTPHPPAKLPQPPQTQHKKTKPQNLMQSLLQRFSKKSKNS